MENRKVSIKNFFQNALKDRKEEDKEQDRVF